MHPTLAGWVVILEPDMNLCLYISLAESHRRMRTTTLRRNGNASHSLTILWWRTIVNMKTDNGPAISNRIRESQLRLKMSFGNYWKAPRNHGERKLATAAAETFEMHPGEVLNHTERILNFPEIRYQPSKLVLNYRN